MRPVSYSRATDVADAIAIVSADPDSAFLAGGTTEVDLMRLNVVRPDLLVDINSLPLDQIEELPDGGLRIGALARMRDVAEAPGVVERFPVIAQALVLGASPQLRDMASVGGNMLQRVRCNYFRDAHARSATSASRRAAVPRLRVSTGATRSWHQQAALHRRTPVGRRGRPGRPRRRRACSGLAWRAGDPAR